MPKPKTFVLMAHVSNQSYDLVGDPTTPKAVITIAHVAMRHSYNEAEDGWHQLTITTPKYFWQDTKLNLKKVD